MKFLAVKNLGSLRSANKKIEEYYANLFAG